MIDKFTDEQLNDYTEIFTILLHSIVGMADKYGLDRDELLEKFAYQVGMFSELSTIKGFHEEKE